MAEKETKIGELLTIVRNLMSTLAIEAQEEELKRLEQEMSTPGFWDDQSAAREKSQRAGHLKDEVSSWRSLVGDCATLQELWKSSSDQSVDELEKEYASLQERFSQLEFSALLSGPHDASNALLAIHAGTGGVDAMDWAEMLFRMYLRYCEKRGWKARILDEQKGGEAGVKTATIEVIGKTAYGYLKAEHGVHRLVRISPFDAEGMRHTSFALVEVIPDMGEMSEITIKPEDLKIDVFRASGHGGQSVNTTDSAVRMTHLPTGIVVGCQNERSQLQNKETAMRYLKAKLARLQQATREEEKQQLRGAYSEAAWGNQIRSYVLNPYRLVKDHRTKFETQDVLGVLDGDLTPFIEAYLRSGPPKTY